MTDGRMPSFEGVRASCDAPGCCARESTDEIFTDRAIPILQQRGWYVNLCRSITYCPAHAWNGEGTASATYVGARTDLKGERALVKVEKPGFLAAQFSNMDLPRDPMHIGAVGPDQSLGYEWTVFPEAAFLLDPVTDWNEQVRI